MKDQYINKDHGFLNTGVGLFEILQTNKGTIEQLKVVFEKGSRELEKTCGEINPNDTRKISSTVEGKQVSLRSQIYKICKQIGLGTVREVEPSFGTIFENIKDVLGYRGENKLGNLKDEFHTLSLLSKLCDANKTTLKELNTEHRKTIVYNGIVISTRSLMYHIGMELGLIGSFRELEADSRAIYKIIKERYLGGKIENGGEYYLNPINLLQDLKSFSSEIGIHPLKLIGRNFSERKKDNSIVVACKSGVHKSFIKYLIDFGVARGIKNSRKGLYSMRGYLIKLLLAESGIYKEIFTKEKIFDILFKYGEKIGKNVTDLAITHRENKVFWEEYGELIEFGDYINIASVGVGLKKLKTDKYPGASECLSYLKSIAGITKPPTSEEQRKNTLEQNKEFISNVIGILGSNTLLDIILAQHPDYKSIKVQKLESLLADFIGEYEIIQSLEIKSGTIGSLMPYLSVPNVQQAVYESLKKGCIQHRNERKKQGSEEEDYDIITNYLGEKTSQLESIKSKENKAIVDEIVDNLICYFIKVLHYQIPKGVVTCKKQGVEYPYFNQRVNIIEALEKKRFVNADTMGSGKTDSAILTAESSGSKRILVIGPKTVIEDSRPKFLSENSEKNPKGVFKNGHEPIHHIMTNNQTVNDDAKYCLINLEKLDQEKYIQLINQWQPDMIIIDESHEFKNIREGKRAHELLKITSSIPNDGIVILSSGTPIPNRISDLGLLLKIIHQNNELISKIPLPVLRQRIINGDVTDLRNLIIPFMQSKNLKNSMIDLPECNINERWIQPDQDWSIMYNNILENDELSPIQKVEILSKMCNNPQLLGNKNLSIPKLYDVKKRINNLTQNNQQGVIFLNRHITGLIDEGGIFQKEFPEKVGFIHGKNKSNREEILNQFRQGEILILMMSAEIGGVGIDLTNAHHGLIYDPSRTVSDTEQIIARLYRPGQIHNVQITKLGILGSIEEGKTNLAQAKNKIVDKLMNGTPLSMFERQQLQQMESQHEGVNEELYHFYFSKIQQLNKHFGKLKNLTQAEFEKYMSHYGAEYASFYSSLGPKTYQANTNRISSSIIQMLISQEGLELNAGEIVDLASGPKMLHKHGAEIFADKIISIDGNSNYFDESDASCMQGFLTNIPIEDNSVKIAHCSLAYHDLSLNYTKGEYDKILFRLELQRVVKLRGYAIIQIPYNYKRKNNNQLEEVLTVLGFEIIQKFSGKITNANNGSLCLTVKKNQSVDQSHTEIINSIKNQFPDGLKITHQKEILKSNNQQWFFSYQLNGQTYIINLNHNDIIAKIEEEKVESDILNMIASFGSVYNIPLEYIKKNHIIWYKIGSKHYRVGKMYIASSGVSLIKMINHTE